MKLAEFLKAMNEVHVANQGSTISETRKLPAIVAEQCMLVTAYDTEGKIVASASLDQPAIDSVFRELEATLNRRLLDYLKLPLEPERTEG